MNDILMIPKGERQIRKVPLAEFEDLMQIQYTSQLIYQKPAIYENILKRCQKCPWDDYFGMRQKWLGTFHEKEILSGYLHPELVIAWIDERLGYGVFTNKDIPAQALIGEYAGEVKRKRWLRNKRNGYCFDYSAGDFFTPPYLIDAEKKGSLVRFINHSDEPNLEPIPLIAGKVLHIVIYSRCFIPKGSQLTYDYGIDYWAKREDPTGLGLDIQLPFLVDS